MHQTSFKIRQRFLSEQIDIISKEEEPTPPISPPTPKIQPLKLLVEEEMEELFIPESEDFDSDVNRNFSIQFSTTADEMAGDDKQRQPLKSKNSRFSNFPLGKLDRTRSKSLHKFASIGLIYDFLNCRGKRC